MSIIPSYSNQFKKAYKEYENAKVTTLQKQKEYTDAKNHEDDCKSAFFTKALLYYDDEKRKDILNSAEKLHYSPNKVNHLKNLDNEKWNEDFVNFEDILDLQTIENYVKENTPQWEKSIITKFGSFLNR